MDDGEAHAQEAVDHHQQMQQQGARAVAMSHMLSRWLPTRGDSGRQVSSRHGTHAMPACPYPCACLKPCLRADASPRLLLWCYSSSRQGPPVEFSPAAARHAHLRQRPEFDLGPERSALAPEYHDVSELDRHRGKLVDISMANSHNIHEKISSNQGRLLPKVLAPLRWSENAAEGGPFSSTETLSGTRVLRRTGLMRRRQATETRRTCATKCDRAPPDLLPRASAQKNMPPPPPPLPLGRYRVALLVEDGQVAISEKDTWAKTRGRRHPPPSTFDSAMLKSATRMRRKVTQASIAEAVQRGLPLARV